MSVTDVLISAGLLAYCVVVGYALGTMLRWFSRTSRRLKWIVILTVGPMVVLVAYAGAVAVGWLISAEVTSDIVKLVARIAAVFVALFFLTYGVTRKRRDRAGRRRRVTKPAGTHVVPTDTAESLVPTATMPTPMSSPTPSPLPPPAPGGRSHPAPAPVDTPLPTPMLWGNQNPGSSKPADPGAPRLPPRATAPRQFAPPSTQ